ncbi:hypothetical protein ACXR2T_07885 [Leucobacter sp. HY1910]
MARRIERIRANRSLNALIITTKPEKAFDGYGAFGYLLADGDQHTADTRTFAAELREKYGARLFRRRARLDRIPELQDGTLINLAGGAFAAFTTFDGLGHAERDALAAHRRHPELALGYIARTRRTANPHARPVVHDDIAADIHRRLTAERNPS